MSFLWIAGPVLAALVFVLTDWRDKRREAELEKWRSQFGPEPEVDRVGGYRDPVKKETKGPRGAKRVSALPGSLGRMLLAAGGGKRLATFELVPKLAYLAVMHADAMSGSDHQTIVAKLDETAPTLMVRPLALLDGQREPNAGVQFKKDAELMDAFIVDRTIEESETAKPGTEAEDKAIRKWLSPVLREALLDLPDLWLRVDGKVMALTLYGPVDADRMNALVTAADVIFAEHGADGGPSLFGDADDGARDAEEPEAKAPPPKAKKTKKPGAGKSA
jgi:hypothetical protein